MGSLKRIAVRYVVLMYFHGCMLWLCGRVDFYVA